MVGRRMVEASYFVGATVVASPLSIGVLVVVVAFVVLFSRVRRQSQLKRRLRSLRSKWGQPDTSDRDLGMLKEFNASYSATGDEASYALDDSTWNDLHLDWVYSGADRTCSSAGACVLYQILRRPLLSEPALLKRAALIQVFERNLETRQAVQLQLLAAGKANARALISLVFNPPPALSGHRLAMILTALAVLVPVVAMLGGGPLFIAGSVVIFAISMGMHYRTKRKLFGQLTAMRQLGYLINAAAGLGRITDPQLSEYTSALNQATAPAARIARKVAMLLPEGAASGDILAPLLEYVSIYFLHEVRTFHAVLADITCCRRELRTIFSLVGELDALQSIASFRAGLSHFGEPQFAGDGPRLAMQDVRHPLIDNPVPNSIQIEDHGIAITGSNMSGKTTFLRTIGVNVILAQSFFTCLASPYRGRFMKVISSIDESDDLLENKSYYLAEAERLLKIVRESEKPGLVLALIDEPLAGTNSPERLAASREILHYLVANNALAMLCTHDVELVAQLQRLGDFEAWHFSDVVSEQGISFDYRLRAGLDYRGNAIRVLKHLGYPNAIVERALGQFS